MAGESVLILSIHEAGDDGALRSAAFRLTPAGYALAPGVYHLVLLSELEAYKRDAEALLVISKAAADALDKLEASQQPPQQEGP